MIFSRAATRDRSRARTRWILLVAPAAMAGLALSARAQQQYDPEFLMRTSPMPTFSEPPKRDYNLKWGPITGKFFASEQTEFNDNISLDQANAKSDVIFFPNFGVGFQWPISPQNLLEFNIGIGYRAYVAHPDLSSLQITPDSRLLYQMRVGKISIVYHDDFHIQVDPLARPDINGASTGGVIDYKRFNNDIGVQTEWQARSDLSVVSSYDYYIDRSLNSQFTSLDRDDHTFALGAFSKIGAGWTVGLSGAITFTDYLLHIQNGGVSESIGPQATVKISRYLSAEATVGYVHSSYDQTGTIIDRSTFDGISYSLAVKHNMNSRMDESVRVAHSISPGFGSNFIELTAAQYGLDWKVSSWFAINGTFSYEYYNSSGNLAERADRYLWYLGTAWQVARRWNVGLGYSFAWKDSDQPLRDYTQNRVTLDLTHVF